MDPRIERAREIIRQEANIQGIDPDHVQQLFEVVLAESRSIQEQMRGE